MFAPRKTGGAGTVTDIMPGVKLITKDAATAGKTIKTVENYLSGYPVQDLITRRNVERVFGKTKMNTVKPEVNLDLGMTGALTSVRGVRTSTATGDNTIIKSILDNKQRDIFKTDSSNRQKVETDTDTLQLLDLDTDVLQNVAQIMDTDEITGDTTGQKQKQKQDVDQILDSIQVPDVLGTTQPFPEEPRTKRRPGIFDIDDILKIKSRKRKGGEALIHNNPMLTINEALNTLGFGTGKKKH
jgi:hypothetical protein